MLRVIVTVSNRYGSGGLAAARRAAEALGYEYVDEQLPVVVAKRLHIAPEEVDSEEERGPTMGQRMLRVLEMATPEVRPPDVTLDEECFREVQQAVRDYAAHGNVLLAGRGAHAILGRRDDVLRVFIYAPRDWRVHRVMRDLNVDERAAATEADRVDRARAEYMRRYYDMAWTDPANYDLCIDTSSFGISGAAKLIESAVRCRQA